MADLKKNTEFSPDVKAEVASALALIEELSTKSSDSGLSEETCWELFGGPCPEALRKRVKSLETNTPLREESEVYYSLDDLPLVENDLNLNKEEIAQNTAEKVASSEKEPKENSSTHTKLNHKNPRSKENNLTEKNNTSSKFSNESRSFKENKLSNQSKLPINNTEENRLSEANNSEKEIKKNNSKENKSVKDKSSSYQLDSSETIKKSISKENKASSKSKTSKESNSSAGSYVKKDLSKNNERSFENEVIKNNEQEETGEKENHKMSNEKITPVSEFELTKLSQKSLKEANIDNAQVDQKSNQSLKNSKISNELYSSIKSKDSKILATENNKTSADQNDENNFENANTKKETSKEIEEGNISSEKVIKHMSQNKIIEVGLKESTLINQKSNSHYEEAKASSELYSSIKSNNPKTSVAKDNQISPQDSFKNKNSADLNQSKLGVESINSKQIYEKTNSNVEDNGTSNKLYDSIGATDPETSVTKNGQMLDKNTFTDKHTYPDKQSKTKSESISIGTSTSLQESVVKNSKTSKDETTQMLPSKMSIGSEENRLSISEASSSDASSVSTVDKKSDRSDSSESNTYISSSQTSEQCDCVCYIDDQIRRSYKKEMIKCRCCNKKPIYGQCCIKNPTISNDKYKIKLFEDTQSDQQKNFEKTVHITSFNDNKKTVCNKRVQTSLVTIFNNDESRTQSPYQHNIGCLCLHTRYSRPICPDQIQRCLPPRKDVTNKKDIRCSGDFKNKSTNPPVSLEPSDSTENYESRSKLAFESRFKSSKKEEYPGLANSLKEALLKRTVKNTVKKFESQNKYSMFMCSESDDTDSQRDIFRTKSPKYMDDSTKMTQRNPTCECCNKIKQGVKKRSNVPCPKSCTYYNYRKY